jgi:hypothetical protein
MTTTAADDANSRERLGWIARLGIAIMLIGAAWWFLAWPDAQRVPVPCKVVAHKQPKPGKSGNVGRVFVEVDEQGEPDGVATYGFEVVGGFADAEEAGRAFAPWPVGSMRTCQRLPFPAKSDVIDGSAGSLVVPHIVMGLGAAVALLTLPRRIRRRYAYRGEVSKAGPYRTAQSPVLATLPLLRVRAPAFTIGERVVPAIFAALYTVIVVLMSDLLASAKGSALVPGTEMRANVSMALLLLVFPGAICLPAMWAVFAKRGLSLDAARAVATVWIGIPGLERARAFDLPRDVVLAGDQLKGAGVEIPLPTHLPPEDLLRVSGWIARWRDEGKG